MNKIFTQIALGAALLFANVANAQVTETFQGSLATCWTTTNANIVPEKNNSTNNVIGFTNNGNTVIGTPFISITNTLSISFDYKLSSKLQASKTRTFEVGYRNATGSFVSINNPVAVTDHTKFTKFTLSNISIPTGSYQIVIRGAGDGANDFVMIDNLTITGGTLHYSNTCNTAPTASSHTYTGTASQPYTGNFLYDDAKDFDFDGENISVTNIATIDPTVGKVVLNADSTFTFTPATTFTGGAVTFTYTVTDNGYAPMSTTGNVSITYPPVAEPAILPIHFMSFSGNANGTKAQLAWSVAENETGSHFEVEKSTDGKKYQSVATVLTSSIVGTDNYSFNDAAFATTGSFYRIKAINKDNSSSYSKTVYIKGTTVIDNKITLMQNPVQTSLNFAFTSATDETAEVAIYNLAGVKMHSQKVAARKGTNSISLGMDSKYSKGAYILSVQSTTANRSIQLIKQ